MLMRMIDQQYLKTPFYGTRRFTAWLKREGHLVNRKRVQRLMRLMDIQAIYPKPRTSKQGGPHKIYPYLLAGVPITHPDQVWSSDITYIPMARGFMYLTVMMDWHSRYVLTWELSNTLDAQFCLEALDSALSMGKPEIFNSDQGCQYTSLAFLQRLKQAKISISMDGKGRCFDNIFVERLWRTVKYEDIYIKSYETVPALYRGLENYFEFYNDQRVHQALGYRTPTEVYREDA
jgi:putative transposase